MSGPALKVDPMFQRLSLLTGAAVLGALEQTRVFVFGLGGVGGWCAEALARSGVGYIEVVDSDRVCVTNINRQVQATSRTVGRSKAESLGARILEINPRCSVVPREQVFSRESAGLFGLRGADYCIDAIDSLSCKLDLIEHAAAAGARLFSSMGMAQKLDPTRIRAASIWDTRGCPLARLVRQGLRKRGFAGDFTAVYSDERLPLHREIPAACGSGGGCYCPAGKDGAVEWCAGKKVINGSAVTVTAAAGLTLASLVIRDVYARHGGAAAGSAAATVDAAAATGSAAEDAAEDAAVDTAAGDATAAAVGTAAAGDTAAGSAAVDTAAAPEKATAGG